MTLERYYELYGDSDELCNCCKYSNRCSRGVTNYGRNPQYPPCTDASELSDFLDESAVAEVEEEDEEE